MAVSATDQMRLSITTSLDSCVDFVRIQGDVDLSDSHQLGLAADQLVASAATTVYVDLGGTTFMGSTLVAFLVLIATDDRSRRSLILCRPTPTGRRVIEMTGLDKIARLRADLPPTWPDDAGEPGFATRQRNGRQELS
jgi:anti-anti-sigma factor